MTDDPEAVRIIGVNRGIRLALDDEDNWWTIDSYLDNLGDPCDDDDPEVRIAVLTHDGMWTTIDLEDYDRRAS